MKIKWNKINKINTICIYMMSDTFIVLNDLILMFIFEIWKSWKKVKNSKKSFWWQVIRTKDEQKGLNKQMIMLINKKINDKNNSKVKTIWNNWLWGKTIENDVFIHFCFVLNNIHHRLHRILFLEYLKMNTIRWFL